MSENLYSVLSKEIKFPDNFLDELVSGAIQNFLYSETSYANSRYEWLCTYDNLLKLWDLLPDKRLHLLNIPINAVVRNYSKYYISKKEGEALLRYMFDSLKDSKLASDIEVRARISCIYSTSETNPFFLNPKDEAVRLKDLGAEAEGVNKWIKLSISLLKTEEDVESSYNMVVKAPGYTDVKNDILSHALNNDIIVTSILDRIADSSPVSLKRTCIHSISKRIGILYNKIAMGNIPKGKSHQSRIVLPFPEYYNSYYVYDTDIDPSLDKERAVNEIAELEKLLMKFSNVQDGTCLQMVSQVLSLGNLAWLLPNIAKHQRLVEFVKTRIDKSLEPRSMSFHHNLRSY